MFYSYLLYVLCLWDVPAKKDEGQFSRIQVMKSIIGSEEIEIFNIPELDKHFCSSSNNAKLHTKRLVLCDSLVPSPEILTLITPGGAPFLHFSYKNNASY